MKYHRNSLIRLFKLRVERVPAPCMSIMIRQGHTDGSYIAGCGILMLGVGCFCSLQNILLNFKIVRAVPQRASFACHLNAWAG